MSLSSLSAIFSIAFVVIFLAAAAIGALRAGKRTFQVPLSRILLTLGALIVSALLSSILARSVIPSLLMPMVETLMGDAYDPALMEETISAITVMVAGPFIFLALFCLLRPIVSFFVNPLARSLTRGEENEQDPNAILRLSHFSGLSASLGALSGVLLLLILAVPFVGTAKTLSTAVSPFLADQTVRETMPDALIEAVEAVGDNIGTRAVGALGGDALYDMLTTYSTGSGRAHLSREAALIGKVGALLPAITEGKTDPAPLTELKDAFDEATLIPDVASNLLHLSANAWKRGEDFLGIERPDLGNEELNDLLVTTIATFERATPATVKEDVGTLLDVAAVLVEDGVLKEAMTDPVALLKNEQTTADMLLPLLENDRLAPIVGGVGEYGMSLLGSMAGIPKNEASISPSYVDDGTPLSEVVTVESILSAPEAPTGRPPQTEAKALAHACYVLTTVLPDLESMAGRDVLKVLGPVLDAFADTDTIGKNSVDLLLKGLMQSTLMRDKMGFTFGEAGQAANSIANSAAAKTFTGMLHSLSLYIEVLDSAETDSSTVAPAVDALLDDLTPEAADVIGHVTTPSVVKTYGVSEQSAGPVSDLLTNTFSDLSASKDTLTREEYQGESKAVADMMNVLLSISKSGETALFTEDATIGTTAQEYVDTILSSSVMSGTIVDTVYGTGTEPVIDPLSTDVMLTEGDRTLFEAAVRDAWEASAKDEKTEKTLIAIGALLNLEVSL